MGVCDGHGLQGHLVSNFVKVNLPKILSNLINGKNPDALEGPQNKRNSFLPQIGKQNRNPYEIDGPRSENEEEQQEAGTKNEYWLSNQNFQVRDYQIKDAFIRVEQRMETKSRIDAMLSGTTCVMTIFNHDMILCANAGDSRAILISEHDNSLPNGPGEGNYYFTQLSRDHKPDLPDEAQRIFSRNGRIEPSRLTPDMMYGAGYNRRAKMGQP